MYRRGEWRPRGPLLQPVEFSRRLPPTTCKFIRSGAMRSEEMLGFEIESMFAYHMQKSPVRDPFRRIYSLVHTFLPLQLISLLIKS